MDSWETSGKPSVGKAQWEGEDEEEDVLDSWDQEEEQPPEPEKPQAPPSNTDKKKPKKKDGTVVKDSKALAEMTPEERLADKLYRQKLQEESDLVLAKEMFGVTYNGSLESKEDFDKFHSDISTCLNQCVKNSEYVSFAEQLVQTLCLHLNSTDLKKIHNIVGNLHIEKLKLEKGDKAKKKSKNKAKLRMDEETDYNEFSAYTTDDFDDFI